MLILKQNTMSLKAPLAVTSSEHLHFHLNKCTWEIQEHIDHQVLVSLVLVHACSRAVESTTFGNSCFGHSRNLYDVGCFLLNEMLFVAAGENVNIGKRCY